MHPDLSRPQLKIRRVNLDTGRENVVVISRRSKALRRQVFRGFSRVELRLDRRSCSRRCLITDDDALVGPDEIGLVRAGIPAFRASRRHAGDGHARLPLRHSLEAVRAKFRDER